MFYGHPKSKRKEKERDELRNETFMVKKFGSGGGIRLSYRKVSKDEIDKKRQNAIVDLTGPKEC